MTYDGEDQKNGKDGVDLLLDFAAFPEPDVVHVVSGLLLRNLHTHAHTRVSISPPSIIVSSGREEVAWHTILTVHCPLTRFCFPCE